MALFVTLIKVVKRRYSSENYLGLSLTAIFWHFLDVLWVILFLFLYYFNQLFYEALILKIMLPCVRITGIRFQWYRLSLSYIKAPLKSGRNTSMKFVPAISSVPLPVRNFLLASLARPLCFFAHYFLDACPKILKYHDSCISPRPSGNRSPGMRRRSGLI